MTPVPDHTQSEECRHGRPECECKNPRNVNPSYLSSQPLSSGRWDAVGSWEDAVIASRELAFNWAKNLPLKTLHWAITVMASDTNAFSLYERRALLEVVALRLGKELRQFEYLESGENG